MTASPASLTHRVDGSSSTFEGGEARAPLALLASRQEDTLAWGRKWLERFGFRVVSAASLDEAIRIARACPGLVRPGSGVEVIEIHAPG